MSFLHPIFTIPFIFMLVAWYKDLNHEISDKDKKNLIIFFAIVLIIGAGFRYYVGADYPVYASLYNSAFPIYTTYQDIIDKALFRPNSMEIEWIFVLINKILFDFGMPFYALTFVIAMISISLQFSTFYKFSYSPFFSILFYFIPLYFFADAGQIRQGVGTAVCIFSLRYIISRNLWKFLICIFIALGFHKTSIIFLPAYWIVLLPLNSKQWTFILIGCVITSPLELYNVFGNAFASLSPQDVSNAYVGYLDDKYYGKDMESGIDDIIKIALVIVVYALDKKGAEKAHYYEYFRNLGFFGFCLFYILRGNQIFATRLPAVYVVMMGYFVVPGIMASVSKEVQNFLRLGFTTYLIAMYLIFSNLNGNRGGFIITKYKNVLWSPT